MTVRRYDEKVLNALLDKYEKSLLYTGANKRRESIVFSLNRSTFPEYFDESSMNFEIIHEQLMEAEEKGYLYLVWKDGKAGHILEKCILNPEKTTEIYALLHRTPRAEREKGFLLACRRNTGREEVIDRFLFWIENRVRNGESIRKYANIDHPEKLDKLCDLLYGILTNREEMFLREFSIQFFRDSKAAEKELERASAVIIRFSEREDFKGLTSDQLLEEFGIYRNPSWVMIKGNGRFRIDSGAWISLEEFPGGIGLSSTDIQKVGWEENSLPEKVITIENLTSFHRFKEEDSLAVYLGGYHNRVKRIFLRNLFDAGKNSGVMFEHFGDIDCGGFRIFRDLCEKTGIPFRTKYMDQETYLAYLEFGKELSESDRNELKRMEKDPYYTEQKDLFALMLKMGKKIEQECIR